METKILEVTGFPFVGHVNQKARPVMGVERVLNAYKESGYSLYRDDLLRSGVIRSMGYMYDFRPHLKQYVYKQCNSWQEAYAPNKTLLRKNVYGRIDKIIEVV